MLPQQVKAPLQRHLHDVHTLHVQALQAGLGMSTCHMHWSANAPMRVASGYGKMSVLPRSRRGPPDGQHPAASRPHTGLAAGGADRCPAGRDPQSGELSYAPERFDIMLHFIEIP